MLTTQPMQTALLFCVFVACEASLRVSDLEVPPPDAVYRQASQPVAARARDLLSRMTLKEKTAQELFLKNMV